VRDRIVRRQGILLAAGRVFILKGFRPATMEDIATAAEIGVGTLYHYFKSKEHLFASILAESTQILGERLRAAAAKQLPPGLGLVAIARSYVDYFAEYPEYFRIQMSFQYEPATKGGLEKEREKIEKLARQNLELLAEKIRDGQTTGVFRCDLSPMAAATALWASYNGILFTAMNPPLLAVTGLNVEQLLSAAAFLQFTGLGADPATGPIMPDMSPSESSQVSVTDLQEVMRSVPWIDPSAIFAGMRMAFQREKAAGVHEVYRFVILGERGGTWTVTIDDGTMDVVRGEGEVEPSVTIEISDKRFVEMVTGQVEGVELVMSGEMKISGSLQRAAMFRMFFVPEARSD
jgi:AcrR family transcriptional regulator/putative sterol carrier protein